MYEWCGAKKFGPQHVNKHELNHTDYYCINSQSRIWCTEVCGIIIFHDTGGGDPFVQPLLPGIFFIAGDCPYSIRMIRFTSWGWRDGGMERWGDMGGIWWMEDEDIRLDVPSKLIFISSWVYIEFKVSLNFFEFEFRRIAGSVLDFHPLSFDPCLRRGGSPCLDLHVCGFIFHLFNIEGISGSYFACTKLQI